jgi:hypothetical protein
MIRGSNFMERNARSSAVISLSILYGPGTGSLLPNPARS